jgi:ankyrin repeat protein
MAQRASYDFLTANDSYRVFQMMSSESKHQLINRPNHKNQTLLHQLIESSSDTEKDLDTILELLNHGANPNAQDAAGQTPLHLAAKQDDPETIKLLCELGATIDALDNAKQTPAYLAAYSDHEHNMLLLRDYGANLDAKNDMGLNPINIYYKQLNDSIIAKNATISNWLP